MLVLLVLRYFKSHRSSPVLSSCKCCCCFFYSYRVFDRFFLHITAHNCYTTLCSDLPLYGIKNLVYKFKHQCKTWMYACSILDSLEFTNHEQRNLVLRVAEEKCMLEINNHEQRYLVLHDEEKLRKKNAKPDTKSQSAHPLR